MKLKNILVICLVAMAVFSSLAIASAASESILGENFNIPDGYTEDSSQSGTLDDFSSFGAQAGPGSSLMVSDASGENSHSFSVSSGMISKDSAEYKCFTKGDDEIVIYVYKLSGDGSVDIQPNPGDLADIESGHNGYYNEDDGSFIYKDDANDCIVVVFADDKLLSDILT